MYLIKEHLLHLSSLGPTTINFYNFIHKKLKPAFNPCKMKPVKVVYIYLIPN